VLELPRKKRYCNLIMDLATIGGDVGEPAGGVAASGVVHDAVGAAEVDAGGIEPSRREANKQRNRDRLYEAALELFGTRGYVAVSVDDICKRADVGRATFFRLYGTKSGLLLEFNRRLAVEARSAVAQGHAPDATAALRIVQEVLCRAWTTTGAALRDMIQEYLNTVSVMAGTRDSAPDLQIVRDGQGRGEFVDAPNADFVAWLIVSSLSSAVATWVDSPANLERRSRQTLNLLFGGLRAGTGPAGTGPAGIR
jgi:AcrR family transcriptional regulator